MSTVLHWFRRDLRLADNAALYHALKSGNNVQCIFIFDTEILNKLEAKDDARVSFIHTELCAMHRELKELGSGLQVYYGNPTVLWPQIVEEPPKPQNPERAQDILIRYIYVTHAEQTNTYPK